MAANDFYYGNNRPPSTNPHQQQGPYYGGSTYTPSPSSTPAPPYSSAAPNTSNQPPRANTISPFDTVFDDPAYPTDSTQDGFRPNPYGTASTDNMIQQQPPSLYGDRGKYDQPSPYQQQDPNPYNQDTAYYGPGASTSSPMAERPPQAHFADDIAMQNQGQPHIQDPNQPPKDIEMSDHVYESAGASRGSRRKKPRKVGLGELGMFGADKKRIPFVVYFMTAVQVGVFIGQVVRNGILTGSPIMIKPQFNPLIGPSFYVNVNMGARYVPCMTIPDEILDSNLTEIGWPCPNVTSSDSRDAGYQCTLSTLCGMGGVPDPVDPNADGKPNQWWRFITPIFLHGGLIHIAINMLLQMTLAKDMEKSIGPIRFFIVYMSSGIFGNIMGGNFAGANAISQGASGALFGVIALTLLDLLYSWKERRSPVKDLLFIFLDIVICFVLGLLPGLDNFAHIGGFVMGLCLGISVLHSPNSLRKRLGYETSYAGVDGPPANQGGAPPFLKNPTGFFKGRKPLWWIWWIVRAVFLVGVVIVFIVLLNRFYVDRGNCGWCKRLSCLPVRGWCELDDLKFVDEQGEVVNSRMLLP